MYSLVNGLYKITAESIKLLPDVVQFGASSDLIILTLNIQKVFVLYTLVPCAKKFHEFHS